MTDCRNWTDIVTSAEPTSGPLEVAPARHFLYLQVRLGMAVTLAFAEWLYNRSDYRSFTDWLNASG
jgi:hypothetical protein